ncbi:hypothetical protein [Microbacterium sp.]|uniref:hypothetical protein n=1 Tax=Microbacterium sp. TaxID=51671 RepID=UPI0039E463F1
MRVPIEKVPVDARRRALRALQSLTDTGERRLARAELGAEVMPLRRPDLDGVAYWEFEVTGVTTSLPVPDAEAKEFDRGFIIVAAGDHDVPVPHLSIDLAPPSRQLEVFGEAENVFKIDALTYAAEDRAGTLIGFIGTMPPKLAGAPDKIPAKLPQGWATTLPKDPERVLLSVQEPDAEKSPRARLRASREKRPVELSSWRSWKELKDGYADSYRLQLAGLAQRAAHPWGVEALVERFGEGIHAGQSITVPLLERGKVAVTGPAADRVKVTMSGARTGTPSVEVSTDAGTDDRDTTFQLNASYAGGGSETLTFFIVPQNAPTVIVPGPSPLGPVF